MVVVGGHAGTGILSDHCYAEGCHGPNNHAAGQSADNAILGTMLELSTIRGGVWRRRWVRVVGMVRVVTPGGLLAPAAGFSGPKPVQSSSSGVVGDDGPQTPHGRGSGQRCTVLSNAGRCSAAQARGDRAARERRARRGPAAETGRIAVRERLRRRLFPLFWHEAREPLHRAGALPDLRPSS